MPGQPVPGMTLVEKELLIADILDGDLRVVPRGVMAAGRVMQGGRGGVDLPREHVERSSTTRPATTAKFDDTAPWGAVTP